jgi:hypothetical protein
VSCLLKKNLRFFTEAENARACCPNGLGVGT